MADIQRGRTGWKKEEDTLLFAEIEKSVGRGTPLKSVFEAVAEQTGRKPNSVRNYYYARIKEKDLSTTALHAGAFVPFTEEEIHSLLRTVLSAPGKRHIRPLLHHEHGRRGQQGNAQVPE